MCESARVHIFGDTAVKALIRLLSKGLPFFLVQSIRLHKSTYRLPMLFCQAIEY